MDIDNSDSKSRDLITFLMYIFVETVPINCFG